MAWKKYKKTRVTCNTCDGKGTITFPDPNNLKRDKTVNCIDCGGKGWNEVDEEV
jgi:DnaJ-class molecular chaperone